MTNTSTIIPGDWYPGEGLPANARVDSTAHVGSSFSFRRYRSERPVGLIVDPSASLYDTATLHRPGREVHLGSFALLAGGALFCDASIEIGAYSLIAWNVVIMDSTILPLDRKSRRAELEAAASRSSRCFGPASEALPVRIGRNVWISFRACIRAGVHIGDNAIVGAYAVVMDDVPANSIVAGNPARVVRVLDKESTRTEAEAHGDFKHGSDFKL